MVFRKSQLGWVAVIVLCLLPLIRWYFIIQPFSYRYLTPAITLTSLGQISSLVGTVLFSLSFILSVRIADIEDFFGGMNKVYIAHHLIGGISFVLLMIHPLLLSGSYLFNSVQSAALFLLPGEDFAINFGITALFLMMSLLVVTFFMKLPYQIWLLTHKFLGLAFFFGALHAFFIKSDISRDPYLRFYMLTLIGFGFAAYIFRTLLGRIFVRRFPYTVTAVKRLRDTVVEINLLPHGEKPLRYLPGQFVFINFAAPGLKEVHPFSLSSSSTDTLAVTAKILGDYTQRLTGLKVGARAQIEGPYGRFSYFFHHGKTHIWIAGGIGITPFMSMVRSLPSDYAVDLYYSVSTQDEAVYLDELKGWMTKLSLFRLFLWETKKMGRLTAEKIVKSSGRNKEVFICGPPQMMYALKQQFKQSGFSGTHIHTEEFRMLE